MEKVSVLIVAKRGKNDLMVAGKQYYVINVGKKQNNIYKRLIE